MSWKPVLAPFQNISKVANLGERVFLFEYGVIQELGRRDYALEPVALPPLSLGVGDRIQISVVINNLSVIQDGASGWSVRAWLSKSRFFGDTKNIPLGDFPLSGQLPAEGETKRFDVSFVIPNEISTGENHVILSLVSPAGIAEINLPNNTVISATAAITIPEWEFSVAANGNGQVNRDFAATRYPHKAQVSLTASAGKGAIFSGWAGDAYSPNNQITLLMDGNKSLQANFASRANLQLFVQGMGEVTGHADLGSYALNSTANLGAVPAAGWSFSHWSGASTASTPATAVLMDVPKTVTAIFVRSLADWKNSVFNAAQLADPAISGNDADPDGDGVKNWQEHLHGSNPLDRASTGVVGLTLDAGHLRCVFTRLSSPASGFPIRCEAGRSLSDWDSPELEERIISSENGIETIESRLPHGASPRGFIRFRYMREAP